MTVSSSPSNPVVKHLVTTVVVLVLLTIASIGVFSHLESDKEIEAICGYLNGESPGQAAATLATLAYSTPVENDATTELRASWGGGLIQGRRCLMRETSIDGRVTLRTELR